MSRFHTGDGTANNIREFESWNEQMFVQYGNDRLYYHPNFLIRKIQTQRISNIVNFMQVQASDTVLDAGCGEGYLFSRLPRSQWQVGVDLSPTALRIAARRNLQAMWIRADVHKLPFDTHTFDKICCSEVIEHILAPQDAIRELHRVLKSSGRLIMTVPNERSINRIKDIMLRNEIGRFLFPDIPLRTEWHLTEYTPALLRSQVLGYFRILKEKTLPVMGFGLGYCILCAPQ